MMSGKDVFVLRHALKLSQSKFGILLGYANPQCRVSELEREVRRVSRRVEIICEYLLKDGVPEIDKTNP